MEKHPLQKTRTLHKVFSTFPPQLKPSFTPVQFVMHLTVPSQMTGRTWMSATELFKFPKLMSEQLANHTEVRLWQIVQFQSRTGVNGSLHRTLPITIKVIPKRIRRLDHFYWTQNHALAAAITAVFNVNVMTYMYCGRSWSGKLSPGQKCFLLHMLVLEYLARVSPPLH